MAKQHTGWLTILPSGRWYLQAPNIKQLSPSPVWNRRAIALVGPFSQCKTVRFGRPPMHPGRIRTRVRWAVSGSRLILGPLIGILTVGDGDTFRGNRENFRDIVLTGKRLGALVFVFTPEGIAWNSRKVRGFLYDEKQDGWVEAVLPFPDVVYNRIPTRKLEQQSPVQDTLNRLSRLRQVTLFNRSFFNKHQLFSTLEKTPQVSPYLPETRMLESLSRLKVFTGRYPFVYLKPVRGKAGKGIMRLEQKKDGTWQVKRVRDQKSEVKTFEKLGQVWAYINRWVSRKPYIVQQGIPLARYKKRPFDIRVLVQKDGSGDWSVTGIGIRQAGVRSITTHVPRGGNILSPDKVLPHLFGDQAPLIEKNIRDTVLVIARTLDQKMECLAEMSMDLGLTSDGRLWFFEANAKPEKFDEPLIRKTSLTNLIRYAQHVFMTRKSETEMAG